MKPFLQWKSFDLHSENFSSINIPGISQPNPDKLEPKIFKSSICF